MAQQAVKKELKGKVIVGMSGGVDSSVSAYLLKQEGYEVEGLFMKNWEEDDDSEYCSAAEDLNDAQQVCDRLEIPLHKINFAAEYWDNVFEYFLNEYKTGRTPNPDVLCNKEIKFKAFLDYALGYLKADYIAMGHYVRRGFDEHGHVQLLRGLDKNKDQSYFLNALTGEQLAHCLFPVGALEKSEVRQIAEQEDFITAKKKDSTGICFIGERKFKDFLMTYLPAQSGKIESVEGVVLGEHQGLMYHTLGQRKGLGIGGIQNASEEAWYVVDKDLKRNVLLVAQGGDHPKLQSKGCLVKRMNFIDGKILSAPLNCSVKTRYRQQDADCVLYPVTINRDGALSISIENNEQQNEETLFYVRFKELQTAVTPGQSAVFYQGEICLGGATIEQRFSIEEDLTLKF